MKKIYEKPMMEIVIVKTGSMLQASNQSIRINTGTNYNGATIEAKERGGIFSTTDDGYKRSLW